MCQVFEVSQSAFFDSVNRKPSEHDKRDASLAQSIEKIHTASRRCYGTRRIKVELQRQHGPVSRRRIGRIMKRHDIQVKTKRKFVATTHSNHHLKVAPNRLNRQFLTEQPDRVYVGDITYIQTDEGWLYLAVMIDLFSRAVVGWAMSNRMGAELVNQALLMAIAQRKPKPGLMIHSDQGSQYASHLFQDNLTEHGFVCSMSRKANCWDNSVSESFFHTLKTELIYHEQYATREQAQNAIFEYIEVFYNRQRRHSTLGYLSPLAFEQHYHRAA